MPAVRGFDLRVVVATPEADCPASLALRFEGVEIEEHVLMDDLAYGNLYADLWEAGEEFVLCEWDIIPWPGAIQGLAICPEPRCSHPYPLAPGNVALSFGIGKYRPIGPAPQHWRETRWNMLDGQVVPVLNERLGRVHVHDPPVAHARRSAGSG